MQPGNSHFGVKLENGEESVQIRSFKKHMGHLKSIKRWVVKWFPYWVPSHGFPLHLNFLGTAEACHHPRAPPPPTSSLANTWFSLYLVILALFGLHLASWYHFHMSLVINTHPPSARVSLHVASCQSSFWYPTLTRTSKHLNIYINTGGLHSLSPPGLLNIESLKPVLFEIPTGKHKDIPNVISQIGVVWLSDVYLHGLRVCVITVISQILYLSIWE